MDIIVGGFIVGVFVAPILLIWAWARMMRRDRERAQRIQQGEQLAPQGYAERRLQGKG